MRPVALLPVGEIIVSGRRWPRDGAEARGCHGTDSSQRHRREADRLNALMWGRGERCQSQGRPASVPLGAWRR
eukprot:11717885-Alexandrium_andersonii.AAC.1